MYEYIEDNEKDNEKVSVKDNDKSPSMFIRLSVRLLLKISGLRSGLLSLGLRDLRMLIYDDDMI